MDDQKAEKFWNRMAVSYDQEEAKDQHIAQHIVEQTKTYLRSKDLILDFGCGTGSFSNELANSVQSILGIDISSKMIELAQAKADTLKLLNLHYQQVSIFDDSLQTNNYDAVLAFYVLHLLKEPKNYILRIVELLQPGGLLISCTPCMKNKPLSYSALSLLSKIGLTPKIYAFKQEDLENLYSQYGLSILKKEPVTNTSNQYFIVGQKRH